MLYCSFLLSLIEKLTVGNKFTCNIKNMQPYHSLSHIDGIVATEETSHLS